MYNCMDINELQRRYPNIPWTEYLNGLLAPHGQVKTNEAIVVEAPSYLKFFSVLISNTPKRVLANYISWRVLKDSTTSLHWVRTLKNNSVFIIKMTASHLRQNIKIPRWKKCIEEVSDKFKLGLGALYVRKHFDEVSKTNIVKLIGNLTKSFKKLLVKVCFL